MHKPPKPADSSLDSPLADVPLSRMCLHLTILVILFLLPAELIVTLVSGEWGDRLVIEAFPLFALLDAGVGAVALVLSFGFRTSLGPKEQAVGVLAGFVSLLFPLVLYLIALVTIIFV
jgi:hypothetical protein